jgi:very-short-patch-repair endonuclease
LRREQTPEEKHIEKILSDAKIRYSRRGFIAKNYHVIVDFYLPDYGTCLEYERKWEIESPDKKKQARRYCYLTKTMSRKYLKIKNSEIFDITIEKIVDSISKISRKQVKHIHKIHICGQNK